MRMWRTLAVGLGLLLPAACGKSTSVDLPPFAVQLQQVLGSGLSGQDGFGEIYVLTADNRVLRIVR